MGLAVPGVDTFLKQKNPRDLVPGIGDSVEVNEQEKATGQRALPG
jgi:hypothetical protein